MEVLDGVGDNSSLTYFLGTTSRLFDKDESRSHQLVYSIIVTDVVKLTKAAKRTLSQVNKTVERVDEDLEILEVPMFIFYLALLLR